MALATICACHRLFSCSSHASLPTGTSVVNTTILDVSRLEQSVAWKTQPLLDASLGAL